MKVGLLPTPGHAPGHQVVTMQLDDNADLVEPALPTFARRRFF